MKRFMFWWVPKIIHHWIWLVFHKTIVQLTFRRPWPHSDYVWSSGAQIGLTIEH